MSETFTFRMPVPDGADIFSPQAAAAQVGRTISVHRGGRQVAGKVIRAELADEGRAMLVTVSVVGELPWPELPDGSSFSLASSQEMTWP